MRPPRLLLVALLLGAAATGCTSSSSSSSDDGPARFRPPPAAALAAGPCALVAEDLVALGRLSYDLRGTTAPDDAARTALKDAQDRVAAVAESADPSVKPALDQLVVRSGLVRIQSDTRLLKDAVLTGMRTSYEDAVRACSTGRAATPTATTS